MEWILNDGSQPVPKDAANVLFVEPYDAEVYLGYREDGEWCRNHGRRVQDKDVYAYLIVQRPSGHDAAIAAETGRVANLCEDCRDAPAETTYDGRKVCHVCQTEALSLDRKDYSQVAAGEVE